MRELLRLLFSKKSVWCFYLDLSLEYGGDRPRINGGSFFVHQISAASNLFMLGIYDPVVLKAALVHDIVELAGIDRANEIKQKILRNDKRDGRKVWKIVWKLTKKPSQTKAEYYLSVMTDKDKRVVIAKMGDVYSNVIHSGHIGNELFTLQTCSNALFVVYPYGRHIHKKIALSIRKRAIAKVSDVLRLWDSLQPDCRRNWFGKDTENVGWVVEKHIRPLAGRSARKE